MTATTGHDLGNNGSPYRNAPGNLTSGANSTGGKLWLPIWSGEVIHAYDEYNMFEPLVNSRVISSGTTIEIPITGTVSLKPTWNAGEELIGSTNDHAATTFRIQLDKRPMAAHFEMDNVDLMLTQWEYRNELARQAALTLANTRDKQIYSYLVRTAVTDILANDPRPELSEDSALYHDDSSGTGQLAEFGDASQTAADRATGALTFLEKLERYIVYLQEKSIPYGQLYVAVSPQAFMDIRALGVARSSADLGGGFTVDVDGDHTRSGGARQPYFGGTNGLGGPLNMSMGQIHDTLEYMGVTIVKSNHVGQVMGDTSGGTTLGEAKYNLDFAAGKVRGVIWTPECCAAIRLQGLKVDTVDDIRRNTVFTVASMMSGTGVLRPECAALITGLSENTSGTLGTGNNTRAKMRHADFLDVDADQYADPG